MRFDLFFCGILRSYWAVPPREDHHQGNTILRGAASLQLLGDLFGVLGSGAIGRESSDIPSRGRWS